MPSVWISKEAEDRLQEIILEVKCNGIPIKRSGAIEFLYNIYMITNNEAKKVKA
jgi:hypothetical protein